jgi:hypothetical protein
MPVASFDRVRDPLVEKFTFDELPRIAPWVYDEITALGLEEIKQTIADLGRNPDEPQFMTTWVSAVSRSHSDVWHALNVG